MNLYAQIYPAKDETLFSWYINQLRINGLDLQDYKHLVYKKSGKIGDKRINDSILELYSKIPLTLQTDSAKNTLQPFIKIFYKNGNIPYKFLTNIYKTDVFCPECLKEQYEEEGEIKFYLKNQLPFKRKCKKHSCNLYKFNNMNDITTNIESIISSSIELDSEVDLTLENQITDFIDYIYDNKETLNYDTLYGALIEEYAKTLKVIKLGEVSKILEKIPEHLILKHLNDETTVYLLDYLYKSNLQISHQLFLLLLFVTFKTPSELHKAVLRTINHTTWNSSMYKTLLKMTVIRLKLSKDYRWILELNKIDVKNLVENNRLDEIDELIIDEIIVKRYLGRLWNIPRKFLSMIQGENALLILDLYTNKLISISKSNLIKSIKTNSKIEPEYIFNQNEFIYKETIKMLRR